VDDDDHNQKQKLFFKFYFPHLIDDAWKGIWKPNVALCLLAMNDN
jgi:hypothetical protein